MAARTPEEDAAVLFVDRLAVALPDLTRRAQHLRAALLAARQRRAA